MLVLSRKSGERIYVGDDIVIEIKRVTGTRVTIAIDAPRNLRVLRGELKQATTEFKGEMPACNVADAQAIQERNDQQGESICGSRRQQALPLNATAPQATAPQATAQPAIAASDAFLLKKPIAGPALGDIEPGNPNFA